MGITIGTGPDSWGVWFPSDSKQPPWQQYLNEAAEAGYEWTELGPIGYLPTDADVLCAELVQRSLKLCGGFVMHHLEDMNGVDLVLRDIDQVADPYQKLGARFIVLIDDVYTNLHTGERERPKELDEVGWARLIETVNRSQERAESYGLQVVFHPHADTHVENHQQMERFLAETDPSVMLCLDTGHDAYTGGDPINFFEKHHKRIPYLHLKSIRGDLREKVLREGIPFATAVAQGMFCEPSEGEVDFERLRDVVDEIGYEGFGVVEQDMYPPAPGVPFQIAKRTRDYLRNIGLG